ncbi:hypothetical protein [Acidisphaera sp. L21]|uniref:hypothetical protein n=1 Tax=Acidisphaera sp. L21 TaxID=1641851 RepID=UPI00131DC675|nr:hypothetical protein [Acidisphaera sp. L21]
MAPRAGLLLTGTAPVPNTGAGSNFGCGRSASAEGGGALARAEHDAAPGSPQEDCAAIQSRTLAQADRDAAELRLERDQVLADISLLRDWAIERPAAGQLSVWQTIVVWLRGKRKTRHFWLQDANTARNARDWPRAAMVDARRLDLVPGEAAIWIQYGHALKESGELDCALLAYERSRLLDPADSDRDIHLTHLRRMIAKAKAAAHAG